jgi:thymidylate synthase ThyX
LETKKKMTRTPIDDYIASYSGEPRGGILKDVAFNRLSFDDGEIHNPDQGQIHVGADGLRVQLVQDFRDEDLQKVLSFAINATLGIDPDNPPVPADWEEMMKGGLQTALEDFRIAFAVYGASRTATHQIVRSRRAAFHQQSQRAHYYGDMPSVRMPESWIGKTVQLWDDEPEEGGQPIPGADVPLEEVFRSLAESSAEAYRLACRAGVSYQDARFALLEGTTNFIMCEYSLAEFIAVYAYRGCSMFQWEIVAIMRAMRAELVEAHPWLDAYVKISCEKTHGALDGGGEAQEHPSGLKIKEGAAAAHACTFQGWEEVEGQCDFPWARESNRTFRSERHAIKRKKD